MASIRHSTSVASAVCKQTGNARVARPVASVQTFNSASLSSVRTAASPLLQSSQRLSSISSSPLAIHQTRTFLTQLRRQAQALKEQVPSNPTIPSKASKPAPTLQLNNLPYFVRRTGSNQLPVYLVTKAGGTKQLTKIQKTEGDLDTLRTDLAYTLGVDPRSPDVSINRLTGHIIVKGWRKPEIVKFLSERNF